MPVRRVNIGLLEEAYRRGKMAMAARDHAFVRNGLRKARRRDAAMLGILDEGAEIMHALNHAQLSGRGITMQDTGVVVKETTEYQLWKNAYRLADQGFRDDDPDRDEIDVYTWIYGMADWIVRYQSLA